MGLFLGGQLFYTDKQTGTLSFKPCDDPLLFGLLSFVKRDFVD